MTNQHQAKKQRQQRRVRRVRARIMGTAQAPRLRVFRSLKHLSVQAIDDQKMVTLASASDQQIKGKTRQIKAEMIGKAVAEKLLTQGIDRAVFDKSHYKYHGLVKAVAEAARAAGLKF